MKFELKHTFDAPVDKVVMAMFDPTLFEHLQANMRRTMQKIEPIDRNEDAESIRRRTRYTPVPLIERIGPKKVPPGAMAFVEESRFDKRARRLDFDNIPDQSTLRRLLVNK